MFDTQLARRKLGKKNTPSPYGRHGAPPLAPPHTSISQHDACQVYVIKTRGYYYFYSSVKARSVVDALCLCLPVAAATSGQF